MKQLNNDNKIYIIKQIKEKEKPIKLKIENIALDKNNFFGKLNSTNNIDLSILDSQYLYHKLFIDNSFIFMGNTSIKLFPNIFKDSNDILTTKISFYYEKKYKINSYQINKDRYIIINGKSIILLEKNKKLLKSKVYNRLNNIAIISVIKAEEEKDKFSGYLTKIQCLVSYENFDNNKNTNIPGSICIQNFILPQFENDVIIDFRLVYFNLDENKLYQIYQDKLIIFLNNNTIFYFLITVQEASNDVNNNKILGIENEIIDNIKIKEDYLFIFSNNTNINIFKININADNKIEIKKIQKLEYNKNKNILLKRKIFYNSNDKIFFVYYIDYLFREYFFSFTFNNNKENITINEIKLNKENQIYFPNTCIKRKINNNIIYYIDKKHSVIFNTNFYNKLIINFKFFHQNKNFNKTLLLLLTNKSQIEIINFDYKNRKLKNLIYIIHLQFDYRNVIDYIMINENYILMLNINAENNSLELTKIDLKSENNNSTRLIESKIAYNNLYYIKELNLLFINSNYGEISVYNIDSRCNLEFIQGFNYGFSSSEIIKIKNSLSEKDFSKLFMYDLIAKKLKTFSLVNTHHVLNYKENELFFFHLIIFLYKEIFIVFIVMENKYTLIKKVLFGKQIKFDKNTFININEPFKFILQNLTYDENSHSFDFFIQSNSNI